MCRSKDANASGKQLPNTACDGSTSPCKERDSKCVVHFRPKKNWNGEDFGFDWMRNTDTGSPGDVKYEDMIGKHYSDAACTTAITNLNNYSDNFKKDPDMLKNLKANEYDPHDIPWKSKVEAGVTVFEKFFASWLSLYPKQINKKNAAGVDELVNSPYTTNTKATLSLYVEIEEAPDLLRFEDNAFIAVLPKEIVTKGKGKGTYKMDDVITVECNQEFSSDQTITLNAIIVNADKTETKKLAGLLKVWANHGNHRRKKKVVLVKIITNVTGVPGNKAEGNTTGQRALFDNYLKQALISVELEEETLDLRSDASLRTGGKYIKGGQIAAYYEVNTMAPSGFISLQDYLYKKLTDQLKAAKAANPAALKDEHTYDNAFRAYYLGNNGGYINASNAVSSLNGYSSGNSVVLFPTKNDQTAAHEFLHSFDLPHSFSNPESSAQAKYTYYRKATNNIMDYSHAATPPITRNSIWHWQWEIANAKADPE